MVMTNIQFTTGGGIKTMGRACVAGGVDNWNRESKEIVGPAELPQFFGMILQQLATE